MGLTPVYFLPRKAGLFKKSGSISMTSCESLHQFLPCKLHSIDLANYNWVSRPIRFGRGPKKEPTHHHMLRSAKPSRFVPFRHLSSDHRFKASGPDKDRLSSVRTLLSLGKLTEALSLFDTLEKPHSSQTYGILFHECATHRCLQEGAALHRFMLSHNPTYSSDLFVSNHLINMYCKCGNLEYAHQLFDEMPRRNIVSWTALISGFSQHERVEECFSMFKGMLLETRPNEFAFASLLSSLGENDGHRGRQVHGLALKMSLDTSVYVANALITMYSRAFNIFGRFDDNIDEAWAVFKNMECPNVISWNSMIAGFSFKKCVTQAISLFLQMRHEGVGFDRATLLSVLSSLCFCNFDGISWGLRFSCGFHCLILKSGFIKDIQVSSALVKAYCDLGGNAADCYKVFVEAGCPRDIVSWTGIIKAFADHDPKMALFLFYQLRQEDLLPDWFTFSIVLKACASMLTERYAPAYHLQVIKAGMENDIVLANALIHTYGRCGSIALSKQVFDEMRLRDLISWNSILKAYAVHGQAKEALRLFQQMNIAPDSATFVALLAACSHAGLVEEGTKLFSSMFTDHGVVPQLDHYATMVDTFGRAGKIEEAEELISKMPMKPDFVVWSALLGSCRKHGATKLAILASEKLKELSPGNSLGYVQMSNMYCSGGSFDEAGFIRNEMVQSQVRKEPGLSWVEIGNQVHEFASGGQYHLERGAICSKLKEMIVKLKETGYVPETGLALFDVEEEHKEEQLYHHSEKVALVFAMMNESHLHCHGNVIKIMKNIRICVDCHNFMRLASNLLKKDIIVRDSNRFHHFKDGLCSCNDYW